MISYNRTPVFPLVIGLILSLIAIGLVTKSEAQANQPMAALVCLLGALVCFAVALRIRRQPLALVVSQEGLTIRTGLAHRNEQFAWIDIERIVYKVEQTYNLNFPYMKREIEVIGKGQVHLTHLRVEGLSGFDFNDFHAEVSQLAPHIVWTFPE